MCRSVENTRYTYTAINEEAAKKFQKMLDLLEDDDDVQEVYHNAEFPEGWKNNHLKLKFSML